MSPFTTRRLLAGGAAAGPLFIAVVLLQLVSRDGFDIRRHPISLLSLGPGGWVQILNFTLTGALILGLAVAARRLLVNRRGGRWGPVLLAGYGLGLVAGGVFVADPGLGFPAGAPVGAPSSLTWHGILHAIAPPVAFICLVAATAVLAKTFSNPAWALYSRTSGVTALVLALPGPAFSVRLLLAMVVTGAWTTTLAHHLHHLPATGVALASQSAQAGATQATR